MLQEDKLKDECGVFGIYSKSKYDVSTMVYYGLCALQHRGEESAGIAVFQDEKLNYYKNMGLVCNVFNEKILNSLKGNSSIGHVRYSTTGFSEKINAQPILGKFRNKIIAMGHNGNLVNVKEIKKDLQDKGYVFQTTIDSEVILRLIEIQDNKQEIEDAIINVLNIVKGAYSLVFLTEDKLIGVRDSNGIRPLCIGKFREDYILASESCAFQCMGVDFVRDVRPGEIVVVDGNGIQSIQFEKKKKCSTCIFEYIYFARPDSLIDEVSVYESRVEAGRKLYEESPSDADVVIGVPDSGIPAAEGYAMASGIPFKMGFVKNKYVGRTFIAPCQQIREEELTIKINPLRSVVNGKRVALIDDSIVRGNTSKHIIKVLKEAGAKEIHFKVASPVIKYPCYFGIATPSKGELIGAKKSVEETRKFLGADSLGYLSEKGLIDIFKGKKDGFCLGCFNGKYPVTLSNDK